MSSRKRALLREATILVVDDHADTREMLRQMLEVFGATVHTASGGHDALAFLKTQVPDLILLDILMPGLDGLEVLRRLRANPRLATVRAVAVTALSSSSDFLRTWEAGFDGHVVKPIDVDAIESVLTRVFWAHRGSSKVSRDQRRPSA